MAPSRSGERRDRLSLDEIEMVFGALAHEARRQIVLLLAYHGPELPSGYLAARLNSTWPTTTRHLHVLEEAGIVSVRRQGRNAMYRVERDHLQRVVGGWLALLKPPTPKRTWRSSAKSTTRKGSTP